MGLWNCSIAATRDLRGALEPNQHLEGAERLLDGRPGVLPECLIEKNNEIYMGIHEGEVIKLSSGNHITHVTKLGQPCVARGFCIISLTLIFFNEIGIYYINQSSWKQIDCKIENCTRILFIADPQLIGKTYESSFISPISRADSDRYLQKTFEHAITHTQPHVICFLGDLMDEGSIATTSDYLSYVKRFHNIYVTKANIKFKMISPLMQRIHIPGDNDIGGENGDYISNSNLRRFENEFTYEDIFDYEHDLRFFKINRMMLDFSNPDRENNDKKLRIGLSHAPILIGGGSLLRSITTELDPHIIFSGDWHESRIFLYPSTSVTDFYENSIKHFDLLSLKEEDHTFLEIMVPTASYRMGKTQIGLGYGVFENYQLRYTVLWLPNRFIFLFCYLFWLLFALSGFIVFKMMTRCPCRIVKRQSPYHLTPTSQF